MLLSAVQVHATVLAATPKTSLPLRLLARLQRRKAVRCPRPDWPILTAFGRYSSERQQWQTSSTPPVNIMRPRSSRIVGLMARPGANQPRLVSKDPKRRFPTHGFVLQKTGVTAVGVDFCHLCHVGEYTRRPIPGEASTHSLAPARRRWQELLIRGQQTGRRMIARRRSQQSRSSCQALCAMKRNRRGRLWCWY